MHRIGTEHFQWQKTTKAFVAEISELPESFSQYFDNTIVLVGEKTGKEIVFEYSGQDRMGGEIYGWRFRAVANNIGIDTSDMQILIIND